jgi:hypothetical protein
MGLSFAIIANKVSAEPWAITPLLGASGNYSSNPELRFGSATAEEHVAALVDLPLTYDTDGLEFSFRPNGRFGNSRGYSSLASNYIHIDSALQAIDDLQSLSLQSQLSREASLYDLGAASPGIGVRRDSELMSGDWARSLSERASLRLDGSWSRLLFGQAANVLNFVDYKYWSAGPTFSYSVTERSSVSLISSFSNYRSLDGRTNSNSQNLQLGLIRQVTELWQVNASIGYSRTQDRQKVYYGPFFLGTEQSRQNSAIYALSVTRRGEVVNLSAAASRSLQPVGVSFLSRRDSLNFTATYALNERWDFTAGAAWQRDAELVLGQTVLNRRYLTAQLAANWHWTEQWTVSLQATRAALTYGPPTISTAANGVSLNLTRQFPRMDL